MPISLILLLIGGCSSLSQGEPFTVRPKVTSLGVENVRIGAYDLSSGLDAARISSLITSSLGANSLPIQATLNMGLGLPKGLPPMALDGFDWRLDVPGAEQISGRYDEQLTLTPGNNANVKMPVTFDPLAGGQRLADIVRLASRLVSSGGLPTGSELTLTPGGISSLGINLPSGLMMPTVRLSVAEDGSLQPQG